MDSVLRRHACARESPRWSVPSCPQTGAARSRSLSAHTLFPTRDSTQTRPNNSALVFLNLALG